MIQDHSDSSSSKEPVPLMRHDPSDLGSRSPQRNALIAITEKRETGMSVSRNTSRSGVPSYDDDKFAMSAKRIGLVT